MFKSIKNRAASHDYEIVEEYTAGLILETWEVKAVANGTCSIAGTHCKLIGNKMVLIGSSIGTQPNDQTRTRELLLTKREIKRLGGSITEKGLTLIPLSVEQKNGKFKLVVGLCRGKKQHDKREADKKRTVENENRRIVKSQRLE
jgi:SsrA-binding protein